MTAKLHMFSYPLHFRPSGGDGLARPSPTDAESSRARGRSDERRSKSSGSAGPGTNACSTTAPSEDQSPMRDIRRTTASARPRRRGLKGRVKPRIMCRSAPARRCSLTSTTRSSNIRNAMKSDRGNQPERHRLDGRSAIGAGRQQREQKRQDKIGPERQPQQRGRGQIGGDPDCAQDADRSANRLDENPGRRPAG